MTLLEISTTAGQKNRSAVQYYFDDRRGLVEAILERHSGPVQESWIEPLTMLRREGLLTLDRIVRLVVSSVVRRAHHEDGGPEYISLARQLLVHPRMNLLDTKMVRAPGALAMAQAITECAAIPKGMNLLWQLRMANLLYHSTGDFLLVGKASGVSREAFEEDLSRTIIGLFAFRRD